MYLCSCRVDVCDVSTISDQGATRPGIIYALVRAQFIVEYLSIYRVDVVGVPNISERFHVACRVA